MLESYNTLERDAALLALDAEYVTKRGYQRTAFFNKVVANHFAMGHTQYWELVKHGQTPKGVKPDVVKRLITFGRQVAEEVLKRKDLK